MNIFIKRSCFTLVIWGIFIVRLWASSYDDYVSFKKQKQAFPIASNGKVASIFVSEHDYSGVIKATQNLQSDIEKVTALKPSFSTTTLPVQQSVIIVGTLGKSQQIDELIAHQKIDVSALKNKWETYHIQVVDHPFPTIEKALVIIGSDKRGTIFGIYDLAQQMGVSPWYWWADVPVQQHKDVYVLAGKYSQGEPKVKYRGIFINDEAPALANWTREKNGGFNHQFYEKVFELILRLKGNYLWPAMWGNAFQADDKLNPILADEYGIVMGTSHHEPLMRAHDEWRRYDKGKNTKWDYSKNDSTLRAFWRSSMEERHTRENIVSVGMRGDGDEPMSEATATALLEKIVSDQRKIISEVTGKDAAQTPQLWALYKEVQDYYDKGMRVPDDVTLLLCDDNWGNIRKLPTLSEPSRKGGYGIYYHFDYVGGPRNYKWLNTNLVPRIWEQMNLAYQYNARQIWIVNVGDIKPMELPTSFFLAYAWNPEKWTVDNIQHYTEQWARQTFGAKNASAIAEMLTAYTQYNARCKPELLSPETYSLTNYDEFKRVVNEYNSLAKKAEKVYLSMDASQKDAYYQLVLYPILACANLNELYYTVAMNRKLAKEQNLDANVWADKAEKLFKHDAELTEYLNKKVSNGKWNHFGDQTHIGYTSWQQPEQNIMPKVERIIEGKAQHNYTEKPLSTIPETIITPKNFKGFIEDDGYVSMEAEHYSRAVGSKEITWKVIPNIGRTAGGVTTFPVTISSMLTSQSPHLAYDILLQKGGDIKVHIAISPTLAFNQNQGLKFGVSFDNDAPQTVEIHKEESLKKWENSVATNSRTLLVKQSNLSSGKHTLNIWLIDAGVVFQKIILDTGGLKPSYLGAPESKLIK